MDRKLLLLINQQWTSPALDRAMAILSSFDLWGPILALALVLLLWRGGFAVRSTLLVAALAAGISDGAVSNPLKHLVGRPRPHQALDGIRLVDLARAQPRILAVAKPMKVKLSKAQPQAEGRSFPSSHVCNTTAVAVAAGLLYRGAAWASLLLPVMVGYSRVYTGAHWPSDVGCSLALGALVGWFVTLGADALWRRHAGRWLPSVHRAHPELLPA